MTQATEQDMIDQGYAEGQKSFECLSKKIMEAFDFPKVHKVMKCLDWYWTMGEERMGIPSIPTIQRSAMELLKKAYDNRKGSISTGGFSAGMEDGELWLSFEVTGEHTCDL